MKSSDRNFVSRDYTPKHAAVYAARYDDGIHAIKVQIVRRFLGNVEGLMVLDLGCGVGNFAMLCADAGAARVIACDFAAAMVAATQQRYGQCFPIVRGSAETPPFTARQFDRILALDVVEHLYQPEQFFASAAALLKPDGHLLVTTDRVARFHVGFMPKYVKDSSRRYLRRLGVLPPPPPSPYHSPLCTHVHEYTLTELIELATQAGFQLTDYDTYSLRPRYSAFGRFVEQTLRGPLKQFKWEYVIYDFARTGA